MKLPSVVKASRDRYVRAVPVPQIRAGENDEAWTSRIRAWSVGLCEQAAYENPQLQIGSKRGDRGRPMAKDSIAMMMDGRLLSWDLLNAASSGHPTLYDDPDSLDLSPGTPDGGVDGQFFETRPEYFRPQNHLGVDVPPVLPPIVGGVPASTGFELDVRASLGRVEQSQARMEQRLASVLNALENMAQPPSTPPAVTVTPVTPNVNISADTITTIIDVVAMLFKRPKASVKAAKALAQK